MNIGDINVNWNVDDRSFSFIRWFIDGRPFTIYPYGMVKGIFRPDFHFKNNRIEFNKPVNWFTI